MPKSKPKRSRPKPTRGGRRINIWIPPRQLEDVKLIENFSNFVQLCIDQAPDIMTYAILHDVDPKKYIIPRNKMEDVVDKFNEKYPLDELTQKRQGKWQTSSPKLPDVLF